ncbi:MAG: hypothetical protein ACLR23_01290 [Clostridia bacterium]
MDEPVLIHVRTVKGKGYEPAEENATRFHGVPSFDIESGNIVGSVFESWSEVLGRNLVRLARKYDNLVAITAAMVQNTGLEEFSHIFPDRVFDVGIAEEHAVTLRLVLPKGIKACRRHLLLIFTESLRPDSPRCMPTESSGGLCH